MDDIASRLKDLEAAREKLSKQIERSVKKALQELDEKIASAKADLEKVRSNEIEQN